MNMADVLEREGEYDAARAHFDESIATFRALGDRWGEAFALDAFGLIAARQGDVETARSLHVEAAAMSREMHDDRGVARALANLGDLAARTRGALERSPGHVSRGLRAATSGCATCPAPQRPLEKLAWAMADDDPAGGGAPASAPPMRMRETIRTRVAAGVARRVRARAHGTRGAPWVQRRSTAALKVGRGLSSPARLWLRSLPDLDDRVGEQAVRLAVGLDGRLG